MTIDRLRSLLRCGWPGHESEGAVQYDTEEGRHGTTAVPWLHDLQRDLWFGGRMLRRAPAFTALAVGTLAVGIGTCTAIFSFVDAILLKPLAYLEPQRLVAVSVLAPNGILGRPRLPDYTAWRAHDSIFTDIAAAAVVERDFNLSRAHDDQPLHVRAQLVTPNYFAVLGIHAAYGRTFAADEDQPGRNSVILLSNALWARSFGADQGAVGKPVLVDGEPHVIAGILPPGTFDRTSSEVWVPFTPQRFIRQGHDPYGTPLNVIARLKAGVTLDQAKAEMLRISKLINEERGRGAGAASVGPMRDLLVRGDLRKTLLVLGGAVGFLLLIACTNVANMLLARAAARAREVAIRLALGAGRFRLIRQFLVESILLSLMGGACGAIAAGWLLQASASVFPVSQLPSVISMDWRVLVFTLTLSVLTGIVFGLAPAWQFAAPSRAARRGDNLASIVKRRARNARGMLVAAEVALTFLLTAGAGLLLRSFVRLIWADSGIETHSLLTFRTVLPDATYPGPPQVCAYADSLLSLIQSLPQVRSAAVATSAPTGGSHFVTFFDIRGRSRSSDRMATVTAVSSQYFAAIGVRLLKGRWFSGFDSARTPYVAVVNRVFERRFLAGQEAVGQSITLAGTDQPLTVIGIVADVRSIDLRRAADAAVYLPLSQLPSRWKAPDLHFVVRTVADPMTVQPALRSAARSLDRQQPLFEFKTMEDLLVDSLPRERLRVVLFIFFGASAAALMTVGIYGVLSFLVLQRTHEIGVRMALGAGVGDIVQLVLQQGLAMTAVGVLLGLGGALALTRVIASFLFGIAPQDPLTFAAVTALVTGLATLACYFPARRAAKVDPLVSLRYE